MQCKVLKDFSLVADGINAVAAKVDDEIEVVEHLIEGLVKEGYVKVMGAKKAAPAPEAKATAAPENKAVASAPENKSADSAAKETAKEAQAPAADTKKG